jgi:trehalose-6-phosphate synthase
VNPYDVDAVVETIRVAAALTPEEQATSMRRLRRAVRKEDVFDWAEQCLAMLEEQ